MELVPFLVCTHREEIRGGVVGKTTANIFVRLVRKRGKRAKTNAVRKSVYLCMHEGLLRVPLTSACRFFFGPHSRRRPRRGEGMWPLVVGIAVVVPAVAAFPWPIHRTLQETGTGRRSRSAIIIIINRLEICSSQVRQDRRPLASSVRAKYRKRSTLQCVIDGVGGKRGGEKNYKRFLAMAGMLKSPKRIA